MKSYLQFSAILFALILGLSTAKAQTTSAPATGQSPAQPGGGAASSLTPEDKAKLLKARQQVFESNPALKAEADELKKQAMNMKGGDATPEDKMAFMQSLQAHQEKMKAAMLKVDPTLGPVIDKAEAGMKQKFQQRASGGN